MIKDVNQYFSSLSLKQHNQAFWVVFVYVLSSLFWKHWGHMHNMHVTWYRVTNVFNFLQGTQISSFYMNLIRTDAFLQKNYDNNEKYYRNSSACYVCLRLLRMRSSKSTILVTPLCEYGFFGIFWIKNGRRKSPEVTWQQPINKNKPECLVMLL